jgi:methanethiol S-methyltransferase
MEYLIICIIWAAYCVLHSFLISTRLTKTLTSFLGKYYAFYRLFYVVFSLWLFIVMLNYTKTIESEIVITYLYPWSVVRLVLTYGSLLMFFWSFFLDYDCLSFFGIRQILNISKADSVNPEEAIKRKGLLGVVRHPMYLALIIFLWSGTFKVIDIYLNLILTAYVLIGTILEEKKLVLEFGDAYTKYQHEVPMLIPFTKPKAV